MKTIRYPIAFPIAIISVSLLAFSILTSSCSIHPSVNGSVIDTPTPIFVLSATKLPGIDSQDKILIQQQSNIFVVNPDGTDCNLITSHNDIFNAALSNDKTRVAYFVDGYYYIKNINSGETSQLNQEWIGGIPFGMGWSADDKKIGFDCAPGTSTTSEICTIDTADKQFQVLTHSEQMAAPNQNVVGGGAQFGSWSRDGSHILFAIRFTPLAGGHGQGIIQMLNLNTGAVSTIFDGRGQQTIANVAAPVLSPDGKTILFQGTVGKLTEIFRINTDGSNLKQVTQAGHTFDITYPVWSPNGDAFFAFTAMDGDPTITGVPTLFSLGGQIIMHLDIGFGRVRSWIK